MHNILALPLIKERRLWFCLYRRLCHHHPGHFRPPTLQTGEVWVPGQIYPLGPRTSVRRDGNAICGWRTVNYVANTDNWIISLEHSVDNQENQDETDAQEDVKCLKHFRFHREHILWDSASLDPSSLFYFCHRLCQFLCGAVEATFDWPWAIANPTIRRKNIQIRALANISENCHKQHNYSKTM